MTITWSLASMTMSRSCSTKRNVIPVSVRRRRTWSMSCRPSAGLTPAMGSSRSTSRGSAIRTRAKSRSLRWPPERTPAYSPACPSSLKSASSSAARSRALARASVQRPDGTPAHSTAHRDGGSRRPGCCPGPTCGSGCGALGTFARGRGARCDAVASGRSAGLRIALVPRSAERKPEITLNNVDLPAPFGPIRAVIDPVLHIE